MTSHTWEHVKELLHQAMQLPPEQRSPFLDQVCASQPDLRAELESLLSAGADLSVGFMLSSPLGNMLPGNLLDDTLIGGALGSAAFSGALQPDQIFAQHFLLVRQLGEGGMGQVWLAEQTAPVRRQVALKLIKAGMYDASVVQRFQAERQSLAIMDHPAIAKVFEAGTTPQGQPYFVMEYVPGLPITDYCDQKKLKIRERLELFIQACEGVQHAHQKAVIHRDLKPANILVIEVDGKPTPRIIDFGLAKATTPAPDGQGLTQFGGFVGTPGYMSPEQAEPYLKGDADSGAPDRALDIDTRTDVYSLGVVLYVLLAGSRPFDPKKGQKQSREELLRKLREDQPPKPSSKVGSSRDTSSTTAEARGTEYRLLVGQLRGDLDWITMKALEKERSRRYGAPSELAADIQRYLSNEPILARPASAWYQLGKYTRRHRIAVAAIAGLILLLAAFSVVQAVQLRRIRRERDRANRITDFMTGMFKVSDPNEARGKTVTAREILDKASNDLGAGLATDPEVQSQLMQVMARTYTNLGLYSRAHVLARQALDSRMKLVGPNDPGTLESRTLMGWIDDREGQYTEAEKEERAALADERRVLGPEDPLTLETMDHLAVIVQAQGHYDEQEKLEREVIAISSRKQGPESSQTLRARNNLGTALWNQGRYADAEQEDRQLLQVERRVLGPDHPQTLITAGNLALSLESEGRSAEAEQFYREDVAGSRRVLGPENLNTVRATENLATLICAEGHLAECEKLHREDLEIFSRTLGPEHAETLLTKLNEADVLLRLDHASEAEKLQRETLEAQSRVLGPKALDTLLSESDLARTLIHQERYAEAEKFSRDAFDTQLANLGPQHPDTVNSLQLLGMAMAHLHRYPEAGKLFRDIIAKHANAPSQGDAWMIWYAFACAAVAANQTDDALEYLQQAVRHGCTDADGMQTDPDLKPLRPNPRFQQLVASLKHPAAK